MILSFSTTEQFVEKLEDYSEKTDVVVHLDVDSNEVNNGTKQVVLTAQFNPEEGLVVQLKLDCGNDYVGFRSDGTEAAKCELSKIAQVCDRVGCKLSSGQLQGA